MRAKIKCVARMTRREATKETIYIIYIIAIRKTSIRCTILTPRIRSKNTTLANSCQVHIVYILYIQRIKVI